MVKVTEQSDPELFFGLKVIFFSFTLANAASSHLLFKGGLNNFVSRPFTAR